MEEPVLLLAAVEPLPSLVETEMTLFAVTSPFTMFTASTSLELVE
jgi:hypothetical protein